MVSNSLNSEESLFWMAGAHNVMHFLVMVLLLSSMNVFSCYSWRLPHFRQCSRSVSRAFSISHQDLPPETLYIFDGTAMIYQSYFSNEAKNMFSTSLMGDRWRAEIVQELPHLDVSQSSWSCSALVVKAMTFARFIRDIQPKYVAVAYDSPKRSFRNEMFPAYKKQRPRPPEDLIAQLHIAPKYVPTHCTYRLVIKESDDVCRLMQMLGCTTLRREGFEADDVMASLGTWAKARQELPLLFDANIN